MGNKSVKDQRYKIHQQSANETSPNIKEFIEKTWGGHLVSPNAITSCLTSLNISNINKFKLNQLQPKDIEMTIRFIIAMARYLKEFKCERWTDNLSDIVLSYYPLKSNFVLSFSKIHFLTIAKVGKYNVDGDRYMMLYNNKIYTTKQWQVMYQLKDDKYKFGELESINLYPSTVFTFNTNANINSVFIKNKNKVRIIKSSNTNAMQRFRTAIEEYIIKKESISIQFVSVSLSEFNLKVKLFNDDEKQLQIAASMIKSEINLWTRYTSPYEAISDIKELIESTGTVVRLCGLAEKKYVPDLMVIIEETYEPNQL